MSPQRAADNPFVKAITMVLAVARRGRFRIALIGGFALPFHGVRRATGDVDFLVDAAGADALHAGLLKAGAQCLQRSADAANYAPGSSRLAPVDFVNAPTRRAQDAADIRALVAAKGTRLNLDLLRDYYALFGRERDLDRLLQEMKTR